MNEEEEEERYSEDAGADDDENNGSNELPKDLYAVLGLQKLARPTQKEIRKAYHALCLKLHPDKRAKLGRDSVNEDAAKEEFQTLQKVYEILSDEEKRKMYDEHGIIDGGSLNTEEFENLYDYYRQTYEKVSEDDIVSFEREYLGSEEEERDLKEYYLRFRGDMNKVFQWVMCSDVEFDSHRFAEIVEGDEELERFPKFEEYLDKYVRGKQAPKDPLTNRKSKKKLPKGGGAKIDDETNTNNSSMGDLQALILAKNKNRAAAADDLFARLEAKYAKPEKIKKANNDSGRVKGVKGGKVKKNKK